jgi:phosphatidate cytidylyltransferase
MQGTWVYDSRAKPILDPARSDPPSYCRISLPCILHRFMKRVITAAVLIPLVLLLLFKGSYLMVVSVTALVAMLAAWEYSAIADCHGSQIPRPLLLIATVLLFAAMLHSPSLVLPTLAACSLTLLIVCSFRSPLERVLADTAFSVFGLIYCGLSLASVPLVWVQQPGGPSQVVFLLCIVWAGDVAALYVGRSFGRHKLAPLISPQKSWEGSAASLAGSLLVAFALVSFTRGALRFPGPLAWWLMLAVGLNVFAQVGDLVESAIKRGAGVKDSGTLLPGHGGILDRIDAILLAAPALWYAQWIQQYFNWTSWR